MVTIECIGIPFIGKWMNRNALDLRVYTSKDFKENILYTFIRPIMFKRPICQIMCLNFTDSAVLAGSPIESHCLPAKFVESVDLQDGLLNDRVCTVKFLLVESYFSFNTTHTM